MKKAIYIVTAMNAGGAETVFMKFYRKLDRAKYQLDFCVSSDAKGFYDDEIESLGGHVVHTIKKSRNPFKSYRRLKDIAREGGYCCAVRSTQHSLSAIDLLAMKKGGVPRAVFRSSNTGTTDGDVLNRALHRAFRSLATWIPDLCIAPSTEAGLYMFGARHAKSEEFQILHNAVDLGEFSFSEECRAGVREEFGISSDAPVVGHVGRFNQQKNHGFLLEVFAGLLKERPDAMLLLFGDGERRGDVVMRAKSLGIEDSVIFAGVRPDVNRCYSAMDALLFPSLYEGLPSAVIEAQANGLPCLISDTITPEVVIGGNVRFKSLENPPEDWTIDLDSLLGQRVPDPAPALRSAGYDINEEVHNFIRIVFGEGSAAAGRQRAIA
jgi:glycosyltransferase involved in cell wall biosynthesis